MNKLKISYDSLQDNHDQDLFLHVACFFIGKDEDVTMKILDGCDFHTTVGIQNLIDICLVAKDGDNKLKMHQMIRDMGREIVRLESKEPEKCSRLRYRKDSLNVLREKNGSKKIEGLALHMYHVETPSGNTNKILDLSGSCILTETGDFSLVPNLERLILEDC
ncbi:putative disease resistance protein At4g11170, partial [Prunus avium]|uniref:Disease resistance protein At4g11170 n=1 Tax=Prunus avium TaxID=42229 RepID=A0A6P5RMX7_PRUAV